MAIAYVDPLYGTALIDSDKRLLVDCGCFKNCLYVSIVLSFRHTSSRSIGLTWTTTPAGQVDDEGYQRGALFYRPAEFRSGQNDYLNLLEKGTHAGSTWTKCNPSSGAPTGANGEECSLADTGSMSGLNWSYTLGDIAFNRAGKGWMNFGRGVGVNETEGTSQVATVTETWDAYVLIGKSSAPVSVKIDLKSGDTVKTSRTIVKSGDSAVGQTVSMSATFEIYRSGSNTVISSGEMIRAPQLSFTATRL